MQQNSTNLYSYLLWLFLLPCTCSYAFESGLDQSSTSGKHIQAKEDFINDTLKEGDSYSSLKIQKFIERLIKERDVLIEDLYETEIIENVEIFGGA